jgi:hypothetical protein
MSVYVDIPTASCVGDADGSFKNIGTFATRKEAIDFCREHFGADEEGRVSLVSGEEEIDADDGCPLGSLDPNRV